MAKLYCCRFTYAWSCIWCLWDIFSDNNHTYYQHGYLWCWLIALYTILMYINLDITITVPHRQCQTAGLCTHAAVTVKNKCCSCVMVDDKESQRTRSCSMPHGAAVLYISSLWRREFPLVRGLISLTLYPQKCLEEIWRYINIFYNLLTLKSNR